MAIRNLRRQATNPLAAPGTPTSAPIYVDSDDNIVKMIPAGSGTTEVQVIDASSTQTLTNKTLTSPVIGGDIGVNDDVSIELGTDDDSVLRHKSASLNANTALTDVFIGTPVIQALAANSLIVSNVTASGDIVVAANRGGASEEYVFADASAGTLTLTGPGGVVNFESGTTQVLGINSATVIEVADDVLFTLGNDNDQAALNRSTALATDTAVTGAIVGTPVTTGVAANSLILSNITASGDVLIAANRGGNSEEYLFADSSVGALYLAGMAGGISLGLAPDYPAPDLAGEMVHIWDGTAGAVTAQTDTRLCIESSDVTANYLSFLSPNAATQGIFFGDVDDNDVGGFFYNHSTNVITFREGTATIALPDVQGVSSGICVGATISYTETSATTYTGTVELPANSWLKDIYFASTVVWNGTSAELKIGDDDSDTGYFSTVDLKATDLVVGERLQAASDNFWGATNGAYLTTAGRIGPAAATDSGGYRTVAAEVIGVVTEGDGTGTAGRSFMGVSYFGSTAVAAA